MFKSVFKVKNKMAKEFKCTQLGLLAMVQLKGFESALAHSRYLESKDNQRPASEKDGEERFRAFRNSWCEGYKSCYCNNVCPDKDKCNTKETSELYDSMRKDLEASFKSVVRD